MKITGKTIIVTLMASIVLAVSLPFSTSAQRTAQERGLAVTNSAQPGPANKAMASQSLTSIYTDLNKQCRTLEERTESMNGWLKRCSGVAGYKFLLESDDDALSMTMINPQGKKFDVGLNKLSPDSSLSPYKLYADLGAKVEWRVKREHGAVVPVALIVRVDPWTDGDRHYPTFLAVAKITKREICITNKIAPGARENEEARRAADEAVNKPCLKAIE